ncbi:MAG: InlB B-repeat-containing protein [Paludibacteraceae bacterium]|nr:InlB B-repeat-containing protein [Paludibacteraceae bacterium]
MNSNISHIHFRSLLLLLCVVSRLAVYAVDGNYKYVGSEDWSGSLSMQLSAGGYYEYHESALTGWHDFWILNPSPWTEYKFEYVITDYNGADITNITDHESHTECVLYTTLSHYYIVIWYPNTPYNNSSNPIICAYSELPDDTNCTAPSSVTVTPTEADGWGHFAGETISLTASPVGGAGTPTYQWKLNGVNIAGANSATYIKNNCTVADAGNYTCQISMGGNCSATSADYMVKVYTLQQYTNGSASYSFTRVGNSKVGIASVPLTASGTAYEFKVFAGNTEYYGNNGTITCDANEWVWENGKNNTKLNTSWTGTFSFIIDYTDNGSAPKITVQYPRKTIHMICGSSWCNDNPKFYVHTWGQQDYDAELTPFACESSIYAADIPVYNNTLCFTRQAPSSTGIAWSGSNFWNQSEDITISSYDMFTCTGWNNGKGTFSRGTYTLPKFSISFAGNGSDGGSMANMTNIVCGNDAALTPNAFYKSGYAFVGWNTADNGSGETYPDGATISNVSGNISLFAQWAPCMDIPGTADKSNVNTYIAAMTWYGDNDEYFDYGPVSGTNTNRWAEWNVHLLSSGKYKVTEFFAVPQQDETHWTGHQWLIQLLDASRNVVASYTTTALWEEGCERTESAKWDLSAIPTGYYILRVTNAMEWARPKLKSLSFEHAGLSLTYTKTPDQAEYFGGAYGEIAEPTMTTTDNLTLGSTVTADSNVLTIGSVTITAPETSSGRLINIPSESGLKTYSCIWRFDHWENLPATITDDAADVEAVYIPTFSVEYEPNGGTINNVDYAHWYRYTGNEHDITPLPENVTRDGYIFAGWYQESTTELFSYLTGNYFGDYAGAWCLKAHWILPCDEPQVISRVTLTGSGTSSYTVFGYNNNEYAGTPVVSVGSTTAAYDVDNDSNPETGYQLSAGNDIVFATLRKGAFRVGDKVRVAITSCNTNRIQAGSYDLLDIYYGTNASDAKLLIHIKEVKEPGIYEYFLASDDVLAMNEAGATGVGVFRAADNGENHCVYSVEIYGCRDLVFDDNNATHVWSDPRNWAPTYTEIPSFYQATRILKPCIVDIDTAHAMNVKLCQQHVGYNGQLTINADAALAVANRISVVHGTDYNTLYDVSANDLTIKSNATNQGALVHGDTGNHTHATIEFYARGAGAPDWDAATWQYMGVPFSDVTRAQSHYEGSWMCRWIEDVSGNAGSNWKFVQKTEALTPFVGYCLTQEEAKTFVNTGTLVPSVNQTLNLTCDGTDYKGWNMFSNSWMAPINITRFIASDFGDAQATIYLFNTGINEGDQTSFSATTAAGQYVAIPIASASGMLDDYQHIAPMQGFYIVTETATTLTLDYDRLVRNAEGHENDPISVGPNRAPQRNAQASSMPRIIMDVTGKRFADRLYLFENAEQTNAFDNAWDGLKFEGEKYAPQLMTHTDTLELAVDVSPSFANKHIAFRAGEDTEYTLHFSSTEPGLRLRDLLTLQETDITDGASYTFATYDKEKHVRFEIIDNRYDTSTPTILEQADATDNEILQMTIYSTDGRLIEHRTSDFNRSFDHLQSGIYIIHIITTGSMQVQKIKL